MKPRSAIGTDYLAGKMATAVRVDLAAIFSFGVYCRMAARSQRRYGTASSSGDVLLHGTTMLESFSEEEHRASQTYWLKETPYGAASRYARQRHLSNQSIRSCAREWRNAALNRRVARFCVGHYRRWRRHFRSGGGGVFWSICVAIGFRSGLAVALTSLCFGSENFAISSQGYTSTAWQPRIALRNSRILGTPIAAQNRRTFCWIVFGAGCSDQDQQFTSGSTDRRCSPFTTASSVAVAPGRTDISCSTSSWLQRDCIRQLPWWRPAGNWQFSGCQHPSGLLGCFFSQRAAFFCTFPLRYWLLLLYSEVQAHVA